MDHVKHSGYLKKFKTMKKKYFVLRMDNDCDVGDDGNTINKMRNGPSSGSNHTGPLNPMDTNSTTTTTTSIITTTNSPSNAPNWKLEYYDSEKKYKSRSTIGKKLVQLRECFSINRKFDSKNRLLIAIYTDDDIHTLIAETEKDLEEWLQALNEVFLQGKTDEAIYTETGIKKVPRPQFSHVWQVTITKRALGAARNMTGTHRICLAKHSLHALKVDPHSDDPKNYEFPLNAIRRCGHSENYFFLELGRGVKEGPGELWMRTEDSGMAQNMHEMILSAMKTSKSSEDSITLGPASGRPRSASQSDQSKSTSKRRPTTGPMAAPLPPSVAKNNPDSSVIVNSATTPVATSNPSGQGPQAHPPLRDRCDSMPTRSRNNSETKYEPERETGSHSVHLRHHSASLQPDHVRPQGLYSRGASFSYSPPAANSLLSPTSDACSTESFGSSLSDDLTEGSTTVQIDSYQSYTGQHFSGLPSEPPIKEEDTPFDEYLMMDPQTSKKNSNTNEPSIHHYTMHHHHHHHPSQHHHVHDPMANRNYSLHGIHHDTHEFELGQSARANSGKQGALSRSLNNEEPYSATSPQNVKSLGQLDHSLRKDSMGDYIPVLSPVGSTETATSSAMASHASSRRSSGICDHTRSVSCCEPNDESAYVPMAPPGSASVSSINTTASTESHGFSSCPPHGYLDMAPLSSSLPKSDTHLGTSPPKSFFKELKQEFHLEKVKSYFSPMEEEEDPANHYIKPVRAYSIGARPQISASAGGTNTGNLPKSHLHGGHRHHHHHHHVLGINRSALQKLDYLAISGSNLGEEARVRAYSCGAQAARRKIVKPSIESELGVIKSIEPELKDSKKSSSAPLLEGVTAPRARSATVGSRLIPSLPPNTPPGNNSAFLSSTVPANSSTSNLVNEREDDFFVVDYGKRAKSGSGSSWSGKAHHAPGSRERKSSMTNSEIPNVGEAGRRFSLGTSSSRPRSNSKSSSSGTVVGQHMPSISSPPSGSTCDPSIHNKRETRGGSLSIAPHKPATIIHHKHTPSEQTRQQHSISEDIIGSSKSISLKKPSETSIKSPAEENDYLEMTPKISKDKVPAPSMMKNVESISVQNQTSRKVFGPLPPTTTHSAAPIQATSIKSSYTGSKIPSKIPAQPTDQKIPVAASQSLDKNSKIQPEGDKGEYVRLEFSDKGLSKVKPSAMPAAITSHQTSTSGESTNYSTIVSTSNRFTCIDTPQLCGTLTDHTSNKEQINPPSSSPSPSPSSMSSGPNQQCSQEQNTCHNPQSSTSSLSSSSSSNSNSSIKINTGPSPENASDYMSMTIGPGSSLAASVAAKSKGTAPSLPSVLGPNPSKSKIGSSKVASHQVYRRQISGSPGLRAEEAPTVATSSNPSAGQGFTRKGSCPSNLSAQGSISSQSSSPLGQNSNLISPVPVNRSTQNLMSGLKSSPSPEQGLVMDQSRYFQSIASASANVTSSITSNPTGASTSIIYENVNLPGSATNSRPSSVGSERELNYVALDLAPSTQGPITEVSEDSPRSLKSPPCHSLVTAAPLPSNAPGMTVAEGSGSTPSNACVTAVNGLPGSSVNCSPSAPLTYAQIDFKKSEGLRNATNSRIQ